MRRHADATTASVRADSIGNHVGDLHRGRRARLRNDAQRP
jgi:hypothetical protein